MWKRHVRNTKCCVHEHNPKMNGHYRNWMTCLNGIHDDVVCCEVLSTQGRYYVGYFTVIDCSSWTDKKGNSYQYEVKLLPAKLKTLKKLRRKKESRGTLVGCLYTSTREDSRSPVCGDDFEFQREADMEKLLAMANYKGKKLADLFAGANADTLPRLKRVFDIAVDADGKIPAALAPFNYVELLAPKTPAEMKELLGGGKNVEDDDRSSGSSGSGEKNKVDDDIPF